MARNRGGRLGSITSVIYAPVMVTLDYTWYSYQCLSLLTHVVFTLHISALQCYCHVLANCVGCLDWTGTLEWTIPGFIRACVARRWERTVLVTMAGCTITWSGERSIRGGSDQGHS